MRTKLSTCGRKLRFGTAAEATAAAQRSGMDLRVYRCGRCRQFHLTSRTKGKWVSPRSRAGLG
ncbi:hypothetical protein SAMN05428950_103330 [Sphingomonas sp. OV641]|nr:hypothetical protein SAMN05428950_103330 [Sphingomonas sp. OV641]